MEKRKLAIENKLVQEEINKKKSKKRKSEQEGDTDTPSKVSLFYNLRSYPKVSPSHLVNYGGLV